MTDEEVYINWRNNNSNIDRHNVTETSIGHKHIHWNPDADRRKAFLDGYKQGQKENEELKEKLKGFENGDVAWQGDMDATIKQNLELKKSEKEMIDKLNLQNQRLNELKSENEKLKEVANNRATFIDWVFDKYPEIAKEYIGFDK